MSEEITDTERRMSLDERKYNLIKLNKNVKKLRKLWILSFKRLVIAATICILSLGIGFYLFNADKDSIKSIFKIISTFLFGAGSLATLIMSLTSLRTLFSKVRKDEKSNEDEEKSFEHNFICKSKKNFPRKLDSSESSPLLFVKALIKHIHIMMIVRTMWISLMSCAFIILSVVTILFIFYGSESSGISLFHNLAIILISFSFFCLLEVIAIAICVTYYIPLLAELKSGKKLITYNQKRMKPYILVDYMIKIAKNNILITRS